MKYLCYLLVLQCGVIGSWGQIRNIKAGLWSDKKIWSSNSVPIYSDSVILGFDITIDANAFCKSLNVSNHNIIVNTGVQLTILGQGNDPEFNKGLLAYYPFNDGGKDESGNGYHLLVNGPSESENRFGTAQKAYRFNGISDFMKIPGISKADSLREFTISIWVRATNLTFESFISLLPKEPHYCTRY